jgi:N utilization substance protein B
MTTAPSAEAERRLLAARRAGARLAAVQALYQMEQTGQSARSVIADFMEDRLGLNEEGEPVEEADPDIFKSIVDGTCRASGSDRRGHHEAARRTAGRSSVSTRPRARSCVAGVYELIAEISLPSQIILDEYVSLAHAFFEGAEPKFINGLLDAVSRDIRADRCDG